MEIIETARLGSLAFKLDYHIRYAYLTGAMYKGIASTAMVIKLGRVGLFGFFGTGGLPLDRIESAIQLIQQQLLPQHVYGMNLLCNIIKPELEEKTVNLFLKYGIRYVEASAFMQITPSLVLYRLKGLRRNAQGYIDIPHHILAKVSHPAVAEAFMSPPPQAIIRQLVECGKLTVEEAELSTQIPMAYDICVEIALKQTIFFEILRSDSNEL